MNQWKSFGIGIGLAIIGLLLVGSLGTAESASKKRTDPGCTERVYTVPEGGTLRHTARKYYGKGKEGLYKLIAQRNGVKNPDLVQKGKKLIIPSMALGCEGVPQPGSGDSTALKAVPSPGHKVVRHQQKATLPAPPALQMVMAGSSDQGQVVTPIPAPQAEPVIMRLPDSKGEKALVTKENKVRIVKPQRVTRTTRKASVHTKARARGEEPKFLLSGTSSEPPVVLSIRLTS